jgi:hypothetical protein
MPQGRKDVSVGRILNWQNKKKTTDLRQFVYAKPTIHDPA